MTHGMIVAPQPEAVEAGAEILRAGGNAVDAAIACALVQGVVDPMMTGLAGFGAMQLYLPKAGVHTCIDFHGRAPAGARPEMWADLVEGETRDGFGFILKGRINDLGYQSIAVPGSLKAYAEAHEEFGTMPWRDVVAPAIAHADAGFVVRPHVHRFWTRREGMGRVEMIERLASYANEHGAESGWPYYSLDGRTPVTGKDWDALRHKWRHAHGITNVWQLASLHGVERIKGTMKRAAPRVHNPSSLSAAHLNQKPLQFMHRILSAVTDPGDVVWEPFGGLASAAVAAVESGRFPCVAEVDHDFAEIAAQRLDDARSGRDQEDDEPS